MPTPLTREAQALAVSCWCGGRVVDDESSDAGLNDIDTEIQDVDHEDCEGDCGHFHTPTTLRRAKDVEDTADELLRPRERQKGEDGGYGASDHEGPAFAEARTAAVGFDADVGLNEGARERTGDPDDGEEGFGDAETEEVGRAVGELD